MSIFTDFNRILKGAGKNFTRNSVVSITSIIMISITLFLLASTIMITAVLNYTSANIESKIDITAFFVPEASESKILALKDELLKQASVQDVKYTSSDEALTDFREKHKDDSLISLSLEELGVNPLGGVLTIRAKTTTDYKAINDYLHSQAASDVLGSQTAIEKINYEDQSVVIEKVNSLSNSLKTIGSFITLFFALLAILITYNTIRLGIYISRKEIEIMKLVGAENAVIRGPFLITGFLFGIIATIFTLLVCYAVLVNSGTQISIFLDGFDMYQYFVDNILQLGAVLGATGCLLGVISAFIAINRYLKR